MSFEVERMEMTADLISPRGFEMAVEQLLSDQPDNSTITLVVPGKVREAAVQLVDQQRMSKPYPPIQLLVLPDEMVTDDEYWAVSTQWKTVWSPGA